MEVFKTDRQTSGRATSLTVGFEDLTSRTPLIHTISIFQQKARFSFRIGMASDSLVPSTCPPEAVGRAGAVGWHQRVSRDENVVSARCYRPIRLLFKSPDMIILNQTQSNLFTRAPQAVIPDTWLDLAIGGQAHTAHNWHHRAVTITQALSLKPLGSSTSYACACARAFRGCDPLNPSPRLKTGAKETWRL
ncbi:hypothetical protein NEUTE2DRAFT_134879 [Neurospora tetrasperma FGSC 2509]|nr:hypothetical protein NEUTE2DRAFT_134879 [Neurospora tetrasperma FGSC 2509]